MWFFDSLFPRIPGQGSGDFLVVGIGNPGVSYVETRHNAGFMALDALKERLTTIRGPFRRGGAEGVWGEWKTGARIVCLKPLTYVNRSGDAVRYWQRRLGLPNQKTLVLVDDLHLSPGMLRLRRGGSDGGHNGLKSIMHAVGRDFPRLRIGIGHPPPGVSTVEWVLGKFGPNEMQQIKKTLPRILATIQTFVTAGVDTAMNECNG